MEIQLPTKKGEETATPSLTFRTMVVIGANGSGKTRFGSDIERRYNRSVHRVSAQKSLSIPEFVGTKSIESAEAEFLYGAWHKENQEWIKNEGWIQRRWNNDLNTSLLNDYQQLMVLLHTEEYEASLDYKENGGDKPTTKLDRIQNIWRTILPHRSLRKKAGVIEAYPDGNAELAYNASQMSDGERVIFYLIGEALCAPANSIIIIDEPEMHIHRSLVKKLFDLIEIERPDCAFIYLTHDIDFAFTRQNAVKIWTKAYEGNNIWDYEILDDNFPIPEQLYLELLGSRKSILFIEGEESSIDYKLFEQVFPEYTVKPLGGCDKVIQTVKSFNEQKDYHDLESFGIIDKDRRPIEDIPRLNHNNIWVLDVAEVENLLLIEEIVRAVSVHMGKDPETVFNQIKNNIITFFGEQIENQILIHFKETLRRIYLNISNFDSRNITNAIQEIDEKFSEINKQETYDEIKAEFEGILGNKDYEAILRVFNLKDALIPSSQVCQLTGVRDKGSYINLIISLLKENNAVSDSLRNAIKLKVICDSV